MLINLAQASLLENDPTGALQVIQEALKLDPDSATAHHVRGVALNEKHDVEGAIAECRRAVELEPHYTDARNTLGKILMDQGRFDEAQAFLAEAAADPLYRDSYKPLTSLGIIYYRRGQDDRAMSYLKKAVEAAPDDACIAYYYEGHIALKTRDYPAAITAYSNATHQICANFGEAHIALGMAYERSHQYDLARRTYLGIEKGFPRTKLAEQAMERLRYIP